MDLVRYQYNPVRRLEKVQDLFDRLFPWDRPWLRGLEPLDTNGEWRPAIDFREEKEQFTLRADLPGVKKEDLKISIDGDLLTLRGETKEERQEKSDNDLYCERFSGCFSRTIRLPNQIERDKVSASLKNGVLELRLPKKEDLKVKEIAIDVQ